MTSALGVATSMVGAVLLVLALIIVARRKLVAVTVYGRSMAPTYLEGDRLLVRRTTVTGLRRGQVVVVQRPTPDGRRPAPPGRGVSDAKYWIIKRVAALPGDPVPPEVLPALGGDSARTVPPGMLVLLGDNRSASFDSRQLGYISADFLLGVAVRTLTRTVDHALRPSASAGSIRRDRRVPTDGPGPADLPSVPAAVEGDGQIRARRSRE